MTYLQESDFKPLENCQGFEEPCKDVNAKWERNNTNYLEDKYNWSYLCPEHRETCDAYWDEMWAEYYADQL